MFYMPCRSRSLWGGAKDDAEDAKNEAKDSWGYTKRSARRSAESAEENVKGTWYDAKDSAQRSWNRTKDSVSDTVDDVRDSTRDSYNRVSPTHINIPPPPFPGSPKCHEDCPCHLRTWKLT